MGGDEKRKRRQSAAVGRGDEGNLADDEGERGGPCYRAPVRKTGGQLTPQERVGARRRGPLVRAPQPMLPSGHLQNGTQADATGARRR